MSIPAPSTRQPKMTPKKRAFILDQNLLHGSDRNHLWDSLFPLMTELKTKAQGKRNRCIQSEL